MENLYEKNCIRTFSGIYFNVFEPILEMIKIEDIAHALSMIPRFGGHFPIQYSVSQHSKMVMEHLESKNKLAGLLHDASEAYLLDIPTPIKHNIPGYQEAETKIMQLIAEKFQFQYPFDDTIHIIDKKMLEKEWDFFINYNTPKITKLNCWNQTYSKDRFLFEFNKLKNGK